MRGKPKLQPTRSVVFCLTLKPFNRWYRYRKLVHAIIESAGWRSISSKTGHSRSGAIGKLVLHALNDEWGAADVPHPTRGKHRKAAIDKGYSEGR